MKKLILISGKARSGKDSAANYLMEHFNNVSQMDITGQLKAELAFLLGKDITWIDQNKDTTFFDGASVRSMLQRFGNDIIKKILFKDYWLQERLSRINELEGVILLSGVRMAREVEYFQKNFQGADKRVITLKIIRLDKDGNEFCGLNEIDRFHITETDVDRIEADYTIKSSNLEELYSKLSVFYNTVNNT
jgi:hypothetical protein